VPPVIIALLVFAGLLVLAAVLGPPNWFPFLYLIGVSVAVIAAGFYVNKRMAETGIGLDRSIVGGAPARKPWRGRRKRRSPPRS
jgi:hypothetical protein